MAQTIKAADGSVYTLEGNIVVHSYDACTGETKYFDNKGRLHRWDDAPSLIVEVNGVVVREEYYQKGDLHRQNGPARVLRGTETRKEWYYNGMLHCQGGPAVIVEDISGKVTKEIWYKKNYRHRDDGVAYHKISGTRTISKYYANGKLHNGNGPAYTEQIGDVLIAELYYKSGKLHRLDGPACIYLNEDETLAGVYYYVDGSLSCKDGPAMIVYHAGAPVYTAEYSDGKLGRVTVSINNREIIRFESVGGKMEAVVDMPVENNANLNTRLQEETRSHDETKQALADLLNANAGLRSELDITESNAAKYAHAWKKECDTTKDLRVKLERMTERASAAEARLRESEQEYRECAVDWVALKQKLAAAAEREAALRSALDDNKAKIAAIKQAIE